MFSDVYTHEECIELDLDWLKDELKGLTKRQRRLILDKYTRLVQEHRIGMIEYKAFVKLFNDI